MKFWLLGFLGRVSPTFAMVKVELVTEVLVIHFTLREILRVEKFQEALHQKCRLQIPTTPWVRAPQESAARFLGALRFHEHPRGRAGEREEERTTKRDGAEDGSRA